jgi:hypothetical protein
MKFKNSSDWPNLIVGHCNIYILHNVAKYGLQLL